MRTLESMSKGSVNWKIIQFRIVLSKVIRFLLLTVGRCNICNEFGPLQGPFVGGRGESELPAFLVLFAPKSTL